MDRVQNLVSDCEAMVQRDMPEGYSLVCSLGWYWAIPHATDGRAFGPFNDPFGALDAAVREQRRKEG